MKKLWILTIALSLTVFCVKAQTQIKPGIGINSTNVTGKGANASGQIGWQLGTSVALEKNFISSQEYSIKPILLSTPL